MRLKENAFYLLCSDRILWAHRGRVQPGQRQPVTELQCSMFNGFNVKKLIRNGWGVMACEGAYHLYSLKNNYLFSGITFCSVCKEWYFLLTESCSSRSCCWRMERRARRVSCPSPTWPPSTSLTETCPVRGRFRRRTWTEQWRRPEEQLRLQSMIWKTSLLDPVRLLRRAPSLLPAPSSWGEELNSSWRRWRGVYMTP